MNEDTYKGMTALEKEKILEEKQAKEQQDNYMRSLKERKTKAKRKTRKEDSEESNSDVPLEDIKDASYVDMSLSI